MAKRSGVQSTKVQNEVGFQVKLMFLGRSDSSILERLNVLHGK
jgi:hypothetical protein